MSHVVAISGNAIIEPKFAAIVDYVSRGLRRRDIQLDAIFVRRLPLPARGSSNASGVQDAMLRVESADAVLIAAPIGITSCSCALFPFLEALPCNALLGKPALPIATGGRSEQARSFGCALAPALAALGVSDILPGVHVADSGIQFAHGGALDLDPASGERIDEAIRALADRLDLRRFTTSRPH